MSAIVLTLSMLILQASPVMAHEQFDQGPYHIEVGWVTEPPVTWQQNAVTVIVTNRTSGAGVIGLVNNLTITLSYASQTRTFEGARGDILTTEANGTYNAPVILTQPGAYTAKITGTFRTTSVSITATPDAFETVQDSYASNGPMFPTVSPSPSPTALQNSINTAGGQAMLIGYVGIAVGVVGIIIGSVALIRGRKRV